MEKILKVWKQAGETPLEVIEKIRNEREGYDDLKMTYAGRLDPLAEGELIILVEDLVHEKERYMHLDKEYEVDVLLGISTDTYDTLGLVTDEGVIERNWQEKVQKFIDNKIGEFSQKYPPFSSKTINGIPMFQLTKEGKEFEIPEHIVRLDHAEIIEQRVIRKDQLKEEIESKNILVRGDFRQEEIQDRWNDYFEQTEFTEYPLITIRLKVGSGFYVRQFVEDLGKFLKSNALAFHIKRTQIFDNLK